MIDSGIRIGMDFVTDDGIGKVLCGNDNHISNLRYYDVGLNEGNTGEKQNSNTHSIYCPLDVHSTVQVRHH